MAALGNTVYAPEMHSTLEERRQRLELERLDLDERELALKRKRIEAEEAALAHSSAAHGSTFGIVKMPLSPIDTAPNMPAEMHAMILNISRLRRVAPGRADTDFRHPHHEPHAQGDGQIAGWRAPSVHDAAASSIGPPIWTRPAASDRFKRGDFTPDFVWRVRDRPVVTRLHAGGCRSAVHPKPARKPDPSDDAQQCTIPLTPAHEAPDVVAIGFCHCARIGRHGLGGGRFSYVHCQQNSTSRLPPPDLTAPLNVGAFDFYFSHWQHGIFNTIPAFGLSAPILKAMSDATLLVETRKTRVNERSGAPDVLKLMATCEPGCSACGYNWYQANWRAGSPTQWWDGQVMCSCCNVTTAQFETCKRVCILDSRVPERTNGLLHVRGLLNLTTALVPTVLRRLRVRALGDAMGTGRALGCARDEIPRFAYPFHLSSNGTEDQTGGTWPDVYPRMAYWPLFEAIEQEAAPPDDRATTTTSHRSNGRVVYVSRVPPAPRAILNESVILDKLRALPWHAHGLSFEVLSGTWQPSAFASLAGLIGVHGAALLNAYRMRPRASSVIEIVAPTFPRLCIAAVCAGRGVRHHAFVASHFPSDYEAKTHVVRINGTRVAGFGGGAVHVNQTAFVEYVRRVFLK